MFYRSYRFTVVVLLAVLAIVASAGSAAASQAAFAPDRRAVVQATLYNVVDLGTLGGSSSRATALNDLGQVVGASRVSGDAASHAFRWDPESGTMTDLGTLGGSESSANGINNLGQVVGNSTTGPDPSESGVSSFLWDPASGTMTNLIGDQGFVTNAIDINEQSQVVGNRDVFGYLWEDGTITDVGGVSSTAHAVNDTTQVVGLDRCCAFIWQGGTTTRLNADGFDRAGALDLNNAGQIVGFGELSQPCCVHALLWQDAGSPPTDLGTLGGEVTSAHAVNESGQIVGAGALPGGEQRAVLWDLGGVIVDLNTRIPPGSGWVLNSADDINESGQIVGTGTLNGMMRGFLLDPVSTGTPTPTPTPTQTATPAPAAKVRLGAPVYVVHEGAGSAVLTVKLDAPSSSTVSVDYTTRNRSARAGQDYVLSQGTLVFPPGVTRQTISVPIVDDRNVERIESFQVRLQNPVNAGLGAPRTAWVVIVDNDRRHR